MAIQLNAQRIRIACDASKPLANSVNDAITGLPIMLPSGSALQFEVLFYFGGGAALADANLLDLSIYSAVNIQLQANLDPHNGTIYYAGSVAAGSFKTPTVTQWSAGTGSPNAQLTLFVPSAQNVVPPSNANFWLCIYGVRTAGAHDNVLLFAVNITGRDSGVPSDVTALPLNLKLGGKLPFICSPANGGDGLTRDLMLAPGPSANQWITYVDQAGYNGPGNVYYAMLCDAANGGDGLFRDLFLQNVDGNFALAINQDGHS